MKKNQWLLSLLLLSFLFTCCKDDTTNPIPANIESVTIGTQVWMKRNLDVDHYRNGDTIPQVTDATEWRSLTTGAWCYFNNDSAIGVIYGKLYNWYAVNDPRGLASEGWHIATDSEWTTLTAFLGGKDYAGGKLKATGTLEAYNGLWRSPNKGATNEIGFSALPGGGRDFGNGEFLGIGNGGSWWSATDSNDISAWSMTLYSNEDDIYRYNYHKRDGFSVRCIKD